MNEQSPISSGAVEADGQSSVLEQVRQGDLYALLTVCTKEDLDPLVEIILSRSSNFLDINDAYKTYKPDHTRYHKIIGNEIRLFGGNSIRNIFRGGDGPPYPEIVVDVCKQLGVPYEKTDTVGNEANLLDIFVQKRWQALDPAERQRLAADARKTATDKLSDAAAYSKAAAGFVIGRALYGPMGLAALGIGLVDANFKVTVPCVLHLAYLRRRILEDWPRCDQALVAGSQTPLAADQTNSLVIAAEDGQPVLSLARISIPPEDGAWQAIDASDDGISRLNPLLAAVPSLTVAREVAGTSYMEVVCNSPLIASKTGDGFRGFSVGSKGITEHASLFEPDKLAAMVNVTALMNIASIALAQKHLADISNKLSGIKDGIDSIRKFQNDERYSKLTGSIRYFEQVAPAILVGERPDRVLHQIENLESALLQAQLHVEGDIDSELKALHELKDDEWFGSEEARVAIDMRQRRIAELYREMFLCLRARSCGWQLLCMFPGDEMGKNHRRQDIQKSLDKLGADGDLLIRTDKYLREKIYELSSFWNSATTINGRKLALLQSAETLQVEVANYRGTVQSDLDMADEMLTATKRPVTIAARIEDGRITAIRAL